MRISQCASSPTRRIWRTNEQLILKELHFSGTSESSSATISTRFGTTAGSRFLPSRGVNERAPVAVSYSGADRFRGSSGKSTNPKDEEESKQLATKSDEDGNHESPKISSRMEDGKSNNRFTDNEFLTLTIVTRGTSPTLPASSSYVRNKRAEIGIVHQKEVTRPREPPDSLDKETQCDRGEETSSRFSRFSGSNRVSGAPSWSTYLDKYSSSGASSTGGSSMYSSRGFNNTSSSSARINSFAYRTNETARHEFAAKESSTSGQEAHSSGNRSQNEKVLGGANCAQWPGNENSSASNEDAKTPLCGQDARGSNKEANKDRVRSGEQCFCNSRKIESCRSPGNSRSSSQDLALQRREDSTGHDCRESHENRSKNRRSPVSRCDECSRRRPSIPRLGRSSPKSEMKILKYSSKSDSASPKSEVYERRASTPKSDVSSSSKTEESPRIVEGFCQEQSEEVVSHRHDASQRKDPASRYVN